MLPKMLSTAKPQCDTALQLAKRHDFNPQFEEPPNATTALAQRRQPDGQLQASAAICRSACSNTAEGWPPEIRCLSLMMTAGTERMPWLA